jgi:hypothetical protein
MIFLCLVRMYVHSMDSNVLWTKSYMSSLMRYRLDKHRQHQQVLKKLDEGGIDTEELKLLIRWDKDMVRAQSVKEELAQAMGGTANMDPGTGGQSHRVAVAPQTGAYRDGCGQLIDFFKSKLAGCNL